MFKWVSEPKSKQRNVYLCVLLKVQRSSDIVHDQAIILISTKHKIKAVTHSVLWEFCDGYSETVPIFNTKSVSLCIAKRCSELEDSNSKQREEAEISL